MNPVIVFFRDILDGPIYTITTVICSVLICSCLGYLIDKKNKEETEANKYTNISNPNNTPVNRPVVQQQVPTTQTMTMPKEKVLNIPDNSIKPNIPTMPQEKPIDEIVDINNESVDMGAAEIKPHIQAPIPIKNTIERNPKGIEAPLLPSSNKEDEPLSNPIPVIK